MDVHLTLQLDQPSLELLTRVEQKIETLDSKMDRIDAALAKVLGFEKAEAITVGLVQDKIDALKAEVADQRTVITSGETLLTRINQLLLDALATSTNQADLASSIQAVTDEITAQKSELAASIAANTPSDPAAAAPTA